MPQAVDSELLSYADDTCLLSQHRDIETIEEPVSRDFSTFFDWFVDNKLSVHLVRIKQNLLSFLQNINRNQQDKSISFTRSSESNNTHR